MKITEVHFTGATFMNIKKDAFLSNIKDKIKFNCLVKSWDIMVVE